MADRRATWGGASLGPQWVLPSTSNDRLGAPVLEDPNERQTRWEEGGK